MTTLSPCRSVDIDNTTSVVSIINDGFAPELFRNDLCNFAPCRYYSNSVILPGPGTMSSLLTGPAELNRPGAHITRDAQTCSTV